MQEVPANAEPQTKIEREQLHHQQQLGSSILQQIIVLQIMCSLTFLFSTIFLQYLCMVRNVCTMSGIDAPIIFERSTIAFYVFTLIHVYGVYTSVVEVKPRFVYFIKWPLMLFALITSIFAVIAFVSSANLSQSDVKTHWDQMSQMSRQWYHNDPNLLVEENSLNLLLIGIYHIVNGVLLFATGFFLINYQYIMPGVWRPPMTIRRTEAMPLIHHPEGKARRRGRIPTGFVDEPVEAPKQESRLDEPTPPPKTIFSGPSQSRFKNRQQPKITEAIPESPEKDNPIPQPQASEPVGAANKPF